MVSGLLYQNVDQIKKLRHKCKKKKKCSWHQVHSRLTKGNQSQLRGLSNRLDAWDKRSDLVHWEDLEGLGGVGGGRGDRDGEHM